MCKEEKCIICKNEITLNEINKDFKVICNNCYNLIKENKIIIINMKEINNIPNNFDLGYYVRNMLK